MKKLIIFYSLGGNTKFIAENITSQIGADMLELKVKNDIPTKGFKKYLLGGSQVMKKEKPELFPYKKDFAQYDVLIIGTPVWAFTFTPAFNTFFAENKIENKKIAFFCCHGGSKGKVFDNFKKMLTTNEFIGEIDFKEPLKGNKEKEAQKAREWIKNLFQ